MVIFQGSIQFAYVITFYDTYFLNIIVSQIYIYDLLQVIKCSNIHIFADDIQLNINGLRNQGTTLLNLININLQNIRKKAENNNLKHNPGKSTSIIISRPTINTLFWSSIEIYHNVVDRTKTLYNIGFMN